MPTPADPRAHAPTDDHTLPRDDRTVDNDAGEHDTVDLDPSDIDTLTGLERGRSAGRRLSTARRAAEEGQLTREQFLFVVAMDEFKRVNGVGFPSWTDVLEVVRLLGYRKTQRSELMLPRAEDWREAADATSAVRPERWAERFGHRAITFIPQPGTGERRRAA